MATEYVTLREALKELSDLPTSNAVADHLVSLGILGDRRSGTRCALAKFFTLRTGEYVVVGIESIYRSEWYVAILRSKIGYTDSYSLPERLIQFASEFDCGAHPKLEGE